MFTIITGYSLKDYIRRRRLYLAAGDIVNEMDSLANIAQKYQFSSQSSFTVAFKKMHGMTPGELSKNKGNYKMFVKMIPKDFDIKVPEGLTEEPVIVELQSFSVTGFQCEVKTSQLKKDDNPVSKTWKLYKEHISKLVDESDKETIAIYDYDPKDIFKDDTPYTYILGCKNDNKDSLPKGMTSMIIPSGRYLMFQLNLARSEHTEAFDYIDIKWLPKSEYILSEKPDFEIYRKVDGIDIVDIYISIEEF